MGDEVLQRTPCVGDFKKEGPAFPFKDAPVSYLAPPFSVKGRPFDDDLPFFPRRQPFRWLSFFQYGQHARCARPYPLIADKFTRDSPSRKMPVAFRNRFLAAALP